MKVKTIIIREKDPDAPPLLTKENTGFLFLGAWCSFMICLMLYPLESRAPASIIVPSDMPVILPPEIHDQSKPVIPEAYFLSFNSIHREKYK